jgi:hypothetical protein
MSLLYLSTGPTVLRYLKGRSRKIKQLCTISTSSPKSSVSKTWETQPRTRFRNFCILLVPPLTETRLLPAKSTLRLLPTRRYGNSMRTSWYMRCGGKVSQPLCCMIEYVCEKLGQHSNAMQTSSKTFGLLRRFSKVIYHHSPQTLVLRTLISTRPVTFISTKMESFVKSNSI